MLVAVLEAHPLFELCTSEEQTFLRSYLSTKGDVILSCLQVYPKREPGAMFRSLMRKPIVASLVDFIEGSELPTKEAVSRLVWKTIRKTNKPHEVYRGVEILSDIEGYGVKPADEEVQKLKQQLAEELDRNVTEQ